MLSGNAAGHVVFLSHMLSGNAAPPRPLTIWKLLSLRADVGLKKKAVRVLGKTAIQAAARWLTKRYYMPTSRTVVMRSSSIHVARHMQWQIVWIFAHHAAHERQADRQHLADALAGNVSPGVQIPTQSAPGVPRDKRIPMSRGTCGADCVGICTPRGTSTARASATSCRCAWLPCAAPCTNIHTICTACAARHMNSCVVGHMRCRLCGYLCTARHTTTTRIGPRPFRPRSFWARLCECMGLNV